MENWLRNNKDVLSIRGIEKRIECPPSTLTKVVNGRNLPKKWFEPLRQLAHKMSYNGFVPLMEQTETVGALADTDESFIKMAKKPEDFKTKKPLSKEAIQKMVTDSTKKIKSKKGKK